MENNSPYEYEKPLNSFASKRVKGFAALGLIAVTSALGGGAIASGLSAQSGNQSSPVAASASSQIIDIPIDSVIPKKSSGTILLPDLKLPSWGNTSSATPSAGSPSSATGSNISSVQSSSFEDEDESDVDRKSSRHENKSENRESDDEQDDD
jgi:hypothetical protein